MILSHLGQHIYFLSFPSCTHSSFLSSSSVFFIPSCLHTVYFGLTFGSFFCVHLLWRKEPQLYLGGSPCLLPACRASQVCAPCHAKPAGAAKVFKYMIINIWQRRRLWGFLSSPQPKLLSSTSTMTLRFNESLKKIYAQSLCVFGNKRREWWERNY